MLVKKHQLELDMEQWTGSKLGKEYVKVVLFNLYAEYIMQNAGLDEAQAGIKISRKNIASDMQMTLPLWQKVKRTKKPLDEGERGERKSWLKT